MYTLKKSLGQHFLKDEAIIQKILEALLRQPFARLLEVGPGGGALTRHLLEVPGITFKAVEIDDEKVAWLSQTYPAIKDKLIHKSVLDLDAPFEEPFTIIGNFPYNISTEIVFKILDWGNVVERVIGMFQKEVAQRLAASHGNKVYGVTSVLIQAFYRVNYLFDVPQDAFNPPPKVMSGVIELVPRADLPSFRSYKDFKLLVKQAFTQRRKTLRNACRGLFRPERLADPLFDKRPEQLSVEDFARLTHLMN